MRTQSTSAGREITDYFNSPAWHAPKEAELLAIIMMELMQAGKPTTDKALISSVIKKLDLEKDESVLQSYRNVLTQLMKGSSAL